MKATIASRVWPALVAVAIATGLAVAAAPNDACVDATVVPDDNVNRFFTTLMR